MRRLFLIVVFWGTIPAIFLDPFYGIVHYTLINIIRPEQLTWGDSSATGRIFLAVQLSLLASFLIHRSKLTTTGTSLPFQVKLLWIIALEMVLVTKIAAFDEEWSWYWTDRFIRMTFFCFVMSRAINTTKKLERYYAIAVLWWTLLGIWGIQQKLGGNPRMEGLGGEMMPDINGVAALFIMYFPMAYYSLFSQKKWIRLAIGIPSILIFMIFVLFSDSRGAFLGMAACMAYIFFQAKGMQKFKMIAALIIIAVLFVPLLLYLAPPDFFEAYSARLGTMLGQEDESTGETEYEGSAAGRFAIWKSAWYVFTHHPEYWPLGVGMNSFYRVYPIYHLDELHGILEPEEFGHVAIGGGKQMHNTYLSVLLGGGVTVFVSWIFLVIYSWWQAHNIPKKYPRIVDGVNVHNYARAIETGILGYCICIAFLTLEFIDFFYWFLVMPGVLKNFAEAKLKRQEIGAEDEEEELVPVSGKRPVYAS